MRRRRASILLLAGLLLAIPARALATIDGISPSSGTVEQGESTSAKVTVSSSEKSCLKASASDLTITVDFPGLIDPCGSGTWSVTMSVSTTILTPTGPHTVTVEEVQELLLGVGLTTVDKKTWTLTVTAPATTTTTSSTTTTSTTTTTTTTSTTTTTTTQPGSSSTTSTAGGSTNSATGSVTGSGGTNTTSGTGGSGTPRDTPRDTPRPTPTTVSIPEVALPESRPGDPGTEFSASPVSGPLSRMLSPRLPPPLVDAVLSPLIVLEVVTSAMGQSASALVVPLAALLVYALWLFRDAVARMLRFNRRDLAVDTSGDHPPPRAS